MDGVAQAAAIACDPDAALGARVEALVRVIDTVVVGGAALPAAMIELVDDLALIDAAVAARCASAVCALFHVLGDDPEIASSRRRIVRRLLAAKVTGIALAGLAFAVGDIGPGAQLAARDYVEHIAPLLAGPVSQPLVDAWLGWLENRDDAPIVAVIAALSRMGIDLTPALVHVTDMTAKVRLTTFTTGNRASSAM